MAQVIHQLKTSLWPDVLIIKQLILQTLRPTRRCHSRGWRVITLGTSQQGAGQGALMARGWGSTEVTSSLKLSPAIVVQKVLSDGRWQVEFFNSCESLLPNRLPYHTSTQVHQGKGFRCNRTQYVSQGNCKYSTCFRSIICIEKNFKVQNTDYQFCSVIHTWWFLTGRV